MNIKIMKATFGCIAFFLSTVALLLPAAAQSDDMYGTFSTTKNGCSAGQKSRIVFTGKTTSGPSIIKGSDFECALRELKPAGSGMMHSEAICVVDAKSGTKAVEAGVTLDLGNYSDHFEVAIPELDGWVKMYRCK